MMITIGVVWAGYCSLKSARNLQLLDAQGKSAPSFVDDVKILLDERFHVTLLFIPICGILAFSVLPCLLSRSYHFPLLMYGFPFLKPIIV